LAIKTIAVRITVWRTTFAPMLNLGMLETVLAVCAGGLEVEEGSIERTSKTGQRRHRKVLSERKNVSAC
jgi:hypothetical protein